MRVRLLRTNFQGLQRQSAGYAQPSQFSGSVFAPHILDTNEAKEKDSDWPKRDVSVPVAFSGGNDFFARPTCAANPLARDGPVRYNDQSKLSGEVAERLKAAVC